MLTQMGRIKRLLLSELVNLTGRGLTVIKIKDDDQLLFPPILINLVKMWF